MANGGCITWDDDIEAFFTQLDIGCMRDRGLDLSDYDAVRLKVDLIYQFVFWNAQKPNPRMPQGGRKWDVEKLDMFCQWKTNGCPKTKADCPSPWRPCPPTTA